MLRVVLACLVSVVVLCDAGSHDEDVERHGASRVHGLQVNETVVNGYSELTFSWTACDFCDGYEATLSLDHVSGSRLVPYALRSAVTSLRVPVPLPRTRYRFELKSTPVDVGAPGGSEVSGITFASATPPPVDALQVRPLTTRSIHVEWTSKIADGFLVKVFNVSSLSLSSENVTTENTSSDLIVYERSLQFSNRSTLTVDGLEPATNYEVQVTAFYSPQTDNSSATVVRKQVRTLPRELPTIELRWDAYNGTGFKLLWTNPRWPYPVGHRLTCLDYRHNYHSENLFLDLYLGGSTDLVAVTSAMANRNNRPHCTLQSWFSADESMAASTKLSVPKPNQVPTHRREGSQQCRNNTNYYRISYGDLEPEVYYDGQKEIQGFLSNALYMYLQFRLKQQPTTERSLQTYMDNANQINYQYSLCKHNTSCSDWKMVPNETVSHRLASDDVAPRELRLGATELVPWTQYTLKYRTFFKCGYESDYYSTEQLFDLPQLAGTVLPVSALDISRSKNQVTWSYVPGAVRASPQPDYFLLTHCVSSAKNARVTPNRSSTCSAISVPANNNLLTASNNNQSAQLDTLEQGRVHFVSLQSGKVSGNRALLSAPRVASLFVPRVEGAASEKINLTVTEVNNASATVQLTIDYEGSSDGAPDVLEFHVRVCSRPLALWDGAEALAALTSSANASKRHSQCESTSVPATQPAQLELLRRPWTRYSVRVGACYGAFDSPWLGSAWLPVWRLSPAPLAGLAWDEERALISWKFRSAWTPSGFLVALCRNRLDAPEQCTNIETGPIDRQYHVNLDDLSGNEFAVFVSAFVDFDGSRLSGPRSELVLTKPTSGMGGVEGGQPPDTQLRSNGAAPTSQHQRSNLFHVNLHNDNDDGDDDWDED